MIESVCVETPFGAVRIRAQDDYVVSVDFVALPPANNDTSNKILLQAQQQMLSYCKHAETGFDLPLRLKGTEFQQRVWRALQNIPAGQVLTYGDLAALLKSSPRAIGGACRANPAPIIVPCHRVVSRHGMGGYSGDTEGANIDIKLGLLRHEGVEMAATGRI